MEYKMKVLDLFARTKSLKKPCNDLCAEYFSVEILPEFEPDMVADIGKINRSDIPFVPNIIWASPPCTHFSVSSIGTHWNKDNTPKTERARKSLELVEHTVDLMESYPNALWFMENPRGKLRKVITERPGMIRHQVSYCRYGFDRMKPTDIWTNNPNWTPRPMCHNGHPDHRAAPRGSKTGTQGMSTTEAGKVPYDLLYEILKSCLGDPK